MTPLHIRARHVFIPIIFCLALSGAWAAHSLAQSSDAPWTTPVNVSHSGAASQPVVVAAPDGTLHTLWWDAVGGEQYVRTTNVTGTAWSQPVAMSQIVGLRQVVTNTQTGKVRVTLTAPRDVRLVSDARSNVHAFWYDVDNQLLGLQIQGAGRNNATVLSDVALNMDVTADMSGTLHLAYVQATDSQDSPAGVYYRAATFGGGWSAPTLVYTSTYFRTAKPEQVHVSVAGDGLGRVLVAWDDLPLGRSLYARSADGGRTWSASQTVMGGSASRAVQAHVVSAPDGTFLMFWQDASVGGSCGLSQNRSTDGGQTWSAPERVLSDLSRCPGHWQFASGGSGRLWLVGLPLSDGSSAQSAASGLLAAWDGKTWSKPVDVSLSFRDAATERAISLGCLSISVADNSVGIVGCDANGDVWAARNAVGLDQLMPALKPIWGAPEVLSNENGQSVSDLPALAADAQGKMYAMWSQSANEGQPGVALYAAVWDGNRWSRTAQVLRSPGASSGVLAGDRPAGKAEQPALVANDQKLHAVWSGGTSGEIFYSWAYARDATSAQVWTVPVALPAVTSVGSWPDMLADPRGSVLHVIYAVPYNEKRGIYYVRSNDSGSKWLAPVVVFDAVAAQWDSVDKPRLALDAKANVLHAVWLRASPPGGAGTQAVVYVRSTDGGQTWSAPVQVAEGAVDWPRVAVGGAGQVYLAWNQARTRTGGVASQQSAEVWGQFSPDGGQRWSEAARVRGLGEVSGPVSIASDGAGGLALVGVGPGATGESVLLYSRWNGSAWSEPETFGLGQTAMWGNAAVAAMVPSMGKLSVVLREFLQQADGTEQSGAVATGRDVPVVSPAGPAPTFTPLPTFTPTITPTPRPTATLAPQVNLAGPSQPAERGSIKSQMPLVLGGALVVVVVLGVVVGRIIWAARRYS